MIDTVIFDFDDTLVATNDVYDKARLSLYQLMTKWGLSGQEQWAKFLNDTDVAFVHKNGHLSPDCFPCAMRETCRHFAELSQIDLPEFVLDHAEQLGWSVYHTRPEIIDGAKEVLQHLYGKVRLYLLTEGYPDIQQPRLQGSGLLPYFESCHIVKHKNDSAYQQLIAEHNIDVEHSWMVGNSIRSDVNPALRAGLNMAFFTRSAWSYDQVEMEGKPYCIDTLHKLLGVLGL